MDDRKIIIRIISVASVLTVVTLVIFGVYIRAQKNPASDSVTMYQTTTQQADETQVQTHDFLEWTSSEIPNNSAEIFSSEIENTQSVQVVEKSKNELVSEYVNSINNLKNAADFSLNKSSSMNIQVSEITGGNIAEKILQSFIDDANNSSIYSFKNGVDGASGESSNSVLPPANARADLSADDVKSAEVISYSEAGYTVKFILNDERVSGSGMPRAHLNCLPNLEMDMSESNLTIDNYDVLFSDSTIVAKYDSQGRLVYIEHIARSPGMTCDGTAVISLHVSMSGSIVTTYNITY